MEATSSGVAEIRWQAYNLFAPGIEPGSLPNSLFACPLYWSNQVIHVYSVEKVISKDGTVQLEALPFAAGEMVDVIVLARKRAKDTTHVYVLKNSVLAYDHPFDSVAENDWDALQ